MPTTSDLTTVVAYGDSQTAGFSWGNRLPALSDTIKTAINRGISGQEAGTVAVRQGGIILTTTTAATITGTSPVIVALQADKTPCNIRSSASTMPMVLAGVRGTLNVLPAESLPEGYPAINRGAGVFTGSFVPDTAPDATVDVPVGTAFVSQDVADHPEWAEKLHIIWVGGNDAAFAGTTRVTGVVSAVQAMVDRLKTAVDDPKFLVAARTTGPTNTTGTSSWQTAIDQRDQLAAAFPNNAIRIREHVIEHGLEILGITPTEADLAALAGDTVPTSLTTDGLHFSTDTREKVLAPFIVAELAARGWTTKAEEGEEPMPFAPRTDWKTDDKYPADRIIELEAAAATGEAAAATATAANEAANAAAQSVTDLREDVSKRVPVDTGNNKIYGTGPSGQQQTYPLGGSSATANSIAYRTTGGVLKVGTPTGDDHATTKKYVDDLLAAQATTIADLTTRLTALETPKG